MAWTSSYQDGGGRLVLVADEHVIAMDGGGRLQP
jgi:hypothetical protein